MASSIKGNVWRMFIHVVAVATGFPFIPFLLLFSLSPPLKFHSFVSFPSFKWMIFFYLPIIIHWVSISRKTKTRTILHNIKSESNDKSFLYPRQTYSKLIHMLLHATSVNGCVKEYIRDCHKSSSILTWEIILILFFHVSCQYLRIGLLLYLF